MNRGVSSSLPFLLPPFTHSLIIQSTWRREGRKEEGGLSVPPPAFLENNELLNWPAQTQREKEGDDEEKGGGGKVTKLC